MVLGFKHVDSSNLVWREGYAETVSHSFQWDSCDHCQNANHVHQAILRPSKQTRGGKGPVKFQVGVGF